MVTRLRFVPVCLAIAIVFLNATANAATLAIQPTRLHLGPEQSISALLLRNPTAEDAVVEIDVHSWRQRGMAQRLDPATELIVNPLVFRLPAGESQWIRVGLPEPPARVDAGEVAYRLLIRRLPTAVEQTGISLTLQLSVPVFYRRDAAMKPSLQWHRRRDNDITRLLVHNNGNAHRRIERVRARCGGESVTASLNSRSLYVLPGGTQSWLLPCDSGRNPDFELKALTDEGWRRYAVDPS